MKLPRLYDALWIVFLLQVPLNGTLHDLERFRRRTSSSGAIVSIVTVSRRRDWHQLVKTFIHCFVERDVFLFAATELSSCIASFDTTGNLEKYTSCVGSGFVVVFFSFVSVLLDSGSHGS